VPVLVARLGGCVTGKEAFESKRADAFEEVAAVVFLGACELAFDREVSFGQI
jgi:hypothetical protein